jgi:glucose/arabinose dehydrogenase
MKVRSLRLLAFALVSSFSLWAQSTISLPAPYATPSVYRFPKVIAKPDGAELQLPAGFRIEEFAGGFRRPRFMTLGPGGEILATDSMPSPGGSVYVIGAAERKPIISNLDKPYGLAFWRNYLYVAEPESIKRYPYDAKTLHMGPGQEILSLKGLGAMHWTRTLLFDRRGEKLYVAIGSGSNDTIGEDSRRAAIGRVNPDGSGFEVFASGLRNPVGLRWYLGTDVLWTSVQERDTMGDDLVPDFFTHVESNGFYGWPFAYIGPHPDPYNSGVNLAEHLLRHPQASLQASKTQSLVNSTIAPDVMLGGHVAVLDFIFYQGRQFPEEYRGGAFLAYHGSVNRSKHVGYSVAFIPFKNRKPCGPPREFLTGWMLSPDRDEVWGRPVGLLELPDGSLLISDDGANKIWRLSYKR